jgi:hypothetical protein
MRPRCLAKKRRLAWINSTWYRRDKIDRPADITHFALLAFLYLKARPAVRIPPFLESLFSRDTRLSAFVAYSLDRVSRHILANPMIFFPEYTDHSIEHLELTLQIFL